MSLEVSSSLIGAHAIFSPSQSSWLRYDVPKMIEKVHTHYRVILGTEIHEFAADQISLRQKLSTPKSVKENLRTFIFNKYKDNDNRIIPYGEKILDEINFLPKIVFNTTMVYIQDGVGFKMEPEKKLMYSELFWGTSDSVSFRDGYLRIHDLKTGAVPAHMEQLQVYAALYCLMNDVKVNDISIELRIYQNNEVLCDKPTSETIGSIMNFMVKRDYELRKAMGEL